jgi:N-acetylglucosamine-6-phosphate deacetylase
MAKTKDSLLTGRIARAGTVEEGWIQIEDERIIASGNGQPPRSPDDTYSGVIAPGFCDLQVNGAGGREVTEGNEALDAIDAILLSHGVTAYLPTIVSTDEDTVERALAELGERVEDPASPIVGVHLEGPFLNPEHAGVHRIECLREPAAGVPAYLSSPAIRLVTLAPELPGALELIAELCARGVTVSLGHSGADATTARRAVDAGARLVTHVFNTMAPLHHRAPGLVGVALTDPRLHVGVIADGLHLDPLVLELVQRAAAERVVLVSDAAPGASTPPGLQQIGGVEVSSSETGAVTTAEGRLAGSTLTLDAAVRNWTSMTTASFPQSVAAASETPAAALGLARGLRPGCPADIVFLDEGGTVERVMQMGRWVELSETADTA